MNRPQTLAIVLLAALPTMARAQTNGELLDAHAKTSSAPGRKQGYWDEYTNSFTGTNVNDWNLFSRAGWRALNKGYYDTAEHEFLAALKAARRLGLEDPRLLARSYADYAWAFQKQGKNAEAEPLAKWALIAREASFEPGSPAISQSLNQMGTLYYDLGRYAEAEPLLRRAIDSQAKSAKANPQEHARSQTLMGLLLAVQRRYAESEPYFSKAITLREKTQGPSHPDTGDSLNNLAWTYHEQGKDDEAQPLFERALKIIERSKGRTDYSVAHVVDGLGQILSRQGKVDEAEAYFLRAISIWERFPDEGVSLLEVLRHYADLLEEKGRASDLEKVKSRMAPLRSKYTLTQVRSVRLGRWYRFPEPSHGIVSTSTHAPVFPG
jgi:tetratricopeptide (TPR) repeat protein